MEPDRIIPVLAAVILDAHENVLIARRKSRIPEERKWEFPGGKLKADESPEECLKREIREELSIEIAVGRPYHIVNYQYSQKNILLISYLCTFRTGKVALVDHDRCQWIPVHRLLEFDLAAADIPVARKLMAERGKLHAHPN